MEFYNIDDNIKLYLINNFCSINYITFYNDFSNKYIRLINNNCLGNVYEYEDRDKKWHKIYRGLNEENVIRLIDVVLLPLGYDKVNIEFKQSIGGSISELEYGTSYIDLKDFFPITIDIINYVTLNYYSIKNILLYDHNEKMYIKLVFKLVLSEVFVDIYDYDFVNKKWEKDEELDNSGINEIIDLLHDCINSFKIKIILNESTGGSFVGIDDN